MRAGHVPTLFSYGFIPLGAFALASIQQLGTPETARAQLPLQRNETRMGILAAGLIRTFPKGFLHIVV